MSPQPILSLCILLYPRRHLAEQKCTAGRDPSMLRLEYSSLIVLAKKSGDYRVLGNSLRTLYGSGLGPGLDY